MRSGTSDVYLHEMPGGQYTNLREQARSLGLEQRWPEVARAYAQVNQLFGDIVKVTPTSKVVGDMALFMVANDLTPDDVLDTSREIAFPESVVSMMKGELGFPPDGFPENITKRVLKGDTPVQGRMGAFLPEADLDAVRAQGEDAAGRKLSDTDLASYLMYPKVFTDYAKHVRQYDDVSVLPTPVFFHGMRDGEEIAVEIDRGKTLVVRLTGVSEMDEDGQVRLFFELNGQARVVRVPKAGVASLAKQRQKAEDGNAAHVGAPMPGSVGMVSVKTGQPVKKGDPLVSIEAMKMESVIRAERDATVKAVHVKHGDAVAAKDLLLELA
jgi:pyruvate carboxylase